MSNYKFGKNKRKYLKKYLHVYIVMPFKKVYDYKTTEQMLELRKELDKTNKFKKYWLKKYNIKIKDHEIKMIMQYKSEIKKILPIIDFIKNLEIITSSDSNLEVASTK